MSIHPLNKIKIAGTVIAMIAIGLIVGIDRPDVSYAQNVGPNVQGFLWSDMPDAADHANPTGANNDFGGRGLGWISMRSANPNGGGGSISYGVTLNTTTGELSGQAWSEFGGWLDFDATGPYPVGNSTFNAAARVDGACMASSQSTCPISGWARFVAGTQTGTGGWDGWVSMRGKTTGNVDYGAFYDKSSKTFSGMAWGDTVAGWIDFSRASVDPVPIPMLTCPGVGAYAGTTYNYPSSSPMPFQCTGINPIPLPPPNSIDVCPDTTYPNLPGTQTGNGPWQGSNGIWYSLYPNGQCQKTDDMCRPLPPGNQAPNPSMTWQVGGVWYGWVNNSTCLIDQCIDGKDAVTSGFQAIVPSGYIQLTNGQCIKPANIDCKTNPELCVGGAINPIYKEN